MRTTRVMALVTVLTLSACGADDPRSPVATVSSAETTTEDMGDGVMTEAPTNGVTDDEPTTGDAAAPAPGDYVDLATYRADPGAYQDSRVVLFFHADWCPSCRATDAALVEEGVPAGLTVVQVDFDTQTDLRQEHGVVQQHTFVHVDADGRALSTWSGSVDGEDILARTG